MQDPQSIKGKYQGVTRYSYHAKYTETVSDKLRNSSNDNEPSIVNTGSTSVMEIIVKALQSETEETLQPKPKHKKVNMER